MTAANIVFLVLLVLAAGFLSSNIQRLVRYARIGRADYRLDHPAERGHRAEPVGMQQILGEDPHLGECWMIARHGGADGGSEGERQHGAA